MNNLWKTKRVQLNVSGLYRRVSKQRRLGWKLVIVKKVIDNGFSKQSDPQGYFLGWGSVRVQTHHGYSKHVKTYNKGKRNLKCFFNLSYELFVWKCLFNLSYELFVSKCFLTLVMSYLFRNVFLTLVMSYLFRNVFLTLVMCFEMFF